MNKTELIDRVAEKTRIPKQHISIALAEAFDLMSDAIACDDTIKIRNFGTFKSVNREARTGVNPRTKESIQIPASKAVKFIVAKQLVKELNG